MPTMPQDDRLLLFARWVLNLLLVLAAILAVAIAGAIVALLSGHGMVVRRLAQGGVGPAELPWVIVLLVMLTGGIALGAMFLRHLRQIVATASDGDPFVPLNAQRLKAMGWLVLAMQALAMMAMPLVVWFDSFPDKPNVHRGDNGLSIGMLVLALLLFVLARVFRVGSEMREELQGTV